MDAEAQGTRLPRLRVLGHAHSQKRYGPLGRVPVVWTTRRCTVRPHCPQQDRRRCSAHTTFLVRHTVLFPRVSRALELKIVLGVNEHHPQRPGGWREPPGQVINMSLVERVCWRGGRPSSLAHSQATPAPTQETPSHPPSPAVRALGPVTPTGTRTTNWLLKMNAFNCLIIWSKCFQSDIISPKWSI